MDWGWNMADKYKVEIKTPADIVIDTAITDDALKASAYMESKLADLPDGYWGHIQVIGGDSHE